MLSGDTIHELIKNKGLIKNTGLIVATERTVDDVGCGKNSLPIMSPVQTALVELRQKVRRILPGPADSYYEDGVRIIKVPYHDIVLNSIGPNSLDVRMSNDFQEPEDSCGVIDLHSTPKLRDMKPNEEDGAYYVRPGRFCLVSTVEYFQMPKDIAGQVDSRSSAGRRGLVTQTATNIQAGWEGNLMLEIINFFDDPIRLFPYDAPSQVVFFRLDTTSSNPYHGRYQGQTGIIV